MNRKSNNKQFFFSEELLQEIFAVVGQYNLFSNFTTKENTTERRIIVFAFLNEIISYEKKFQTIILPVQQHTKYILEIGVPNLIKLM